MRQEMDIKSVFNIMIRGYKLILLFSVIGLISALLISKFFIQEKFVSYSSLYVNSNPNKEQSSTINIGDINASQRLISTYIVILQDDEFLKQISENLNNEVSVGFLKNSVKMASVNNTEILRITATTNNPELSAKICNEIMKSAPAELQRVVKAGSVEKIGTAKPASSPSYPNIMQNSVLGFFLGLIISSGIVFLKFYLDNTIKDEEDIKEIFNVPVLGEVPGFISQ